VGNERIKTKGDYDVFVTKFLNLGALEPVPVPFWIGGIILLLAGFTVFVRRFRG
jgi:hypothetical protein